MGFVKRHNPMHRHEVVTLRPFETLVDALGSADPDERRRAARELDATPAAVDPLALRLGDESDPAVQDACLTSLMSIGTEAAVRRLLPLLRSEDARLRNGVIEVLTQLPRETLGPASELLRDEDADVRVLSVNLLRALPDASIPDLLLETGERDPHPNVVAAALEGLVDLVARRDATHSDRIAGIGARFPGEPYLAFLAKLAASPAEVVS